MKGPTGIEVKKKKTGPKRKAPPKKQNPLQAFLASFARLQLAQGEACTVLGHPAYGEAILTSSGARPVLTYYWWPKGMHHHPAMPMIRAIISATNIQISEETKTSLQARRNHIDQGGLISKTPAPEYEQDWKVVSIDDKRIVPVRPFIESFAHHQWLHHSYKRQLTNG